MEELHKKLREIFELMDKKNVSYIRNLKNLAITFKDYEFAAELRLIERELEAGAEGSGVPNQFRVIDFGKGLSSKKLKKKEKKIKKSFKIVNNLLKDIGLKS